MNPGITVLLTIAGLIVTAWPIYYLAKSNAREAQRDREAAIDRAVTEAKAPLIADNERLSAALATAQVRITQLEDRLYGGSGGQ